MVDVNTLMKHTILACVAGIIWLLLSPKMANMLQYYKKNDQMHIHYAGQLCKTTLIFAFVLNIKYVVFTCLYSAVTFVWVL